MPSKNTKTQRRTGKGKSNLPVEKDDGTRWIVVNRETERPAYLPRNGVRKAEAERLSEGLVVDSYIKQINE